MLRSAAIAEIQRGIGYRSDKTDEIVAKLQAAQRELEGASTLPWFLLLEDESIALTAGDGTFTLPSNFIREFEDLGFPGSVVISTNTELIHVRKLDYDEAYSVYAGADAGTPLVYALRKSTLEFFPAPLVDTTLYWSYYAKASTLNSDIENVWLANVPDLLIGMAGRAIAEDLRDPDAVAKFGARETLWKTWLLREMASREAANRTYGLGSSL